jgi:hypothetical protein
MDLSPTSTAAAAAKIGNTSGPFPIYEIGS